MKCEQFGDLRERYTLSDHFQSEKFTQLGYLIMLDFSLFYCKLIKLSISCLSDPLFPYHLFIIFTRIVARGLISYFHKTIRSFCLVLFKLSFLKHFRNSLNCIFEENIRYFVLFEKLALTTDIVISLS